MPIKPENAHRYPDWPETRARILERANHQCEFCDPGTHNCAPHPVTGSRVILTIAHLDPTYQALGDDDLAAMCQRCHLTYDAALHRANRADTLASRRAVGDLFGGARASIGH